MSTMEKSAVELAANQAKWAVQRATSKMNIQPVRIGMVEELLNRAFRRRPDFPAKEFRRLRRETAALLKSDGMKARDMAVMWLRADLLSSRIDARSSADIRAYDIDERAELAMEHTPQLSETEQYRVYDAAWRQLAEFFGSTLTSRKAIVDDAHNRCENSQHHVLKNLDAAIKKAAK